MRAGHMRAAWSIFNQVVQSDLQLAQRDPKFKQNPKFLLNRGDAQREAHNWPQVSGVCTSGLLASVPDWACLLLVRLPSVWRGAILFLWLSVDVSSFAGLC